MIQVYIYWLSANWIKQVVNLIFLVIISDFEILYCLYTRFWDAYVHKPENITKSSVHVNVDIIERFEEKSITKTIGYA